MHLSRLQIFNNSVIVPAPFSPLVTNIYNQILFLIPYILFTNFYSQFKFCSAFLHFFLYSTSLFLSAHYSRVHRFFSHGFLMSSFLFGVHRSASCSPPSFVQFPSWIQLSAFTVSLMLSLLWLFMEFGGQHHVFLCTSCSSSGIHLRVQNNSGQYHIVFNFGVQSCPTLGAIMLVPMWP